MIFVKDLIESLSNQDPEKEVIKAIILFKDKDRFIMTKNSHTALANIEKGKSKRITKIKEIK